MKGTTSALTIRYFLLISFKNLYFKFFCVFFLFFALSLSLNLMLDISETDEKLLKEKERMREMRGLKEGE